MEDREKEFMENQKEDEDAGPPPGWQPIPPPLRAPSISAVVDKGVNKICSELSFDLLFNCKNSKKWLKWFVVPVVDCLHIHEEPDMSNVHVVRLSTLC